MYVQTEINMTSNCRQLPHILQKRRGMLFIGQRWLQSARQVIVLIFVILSFKFSLLIHRCFHQFRNSFFKIRSSNLFPTPHAVTMQALKFVALLLCLSEFLSCCPRTRRSTKFEEKYAFPSAILAFRAWKAPESTKWCQEGVALPDNLCDMNLPGHAWVNYYYYSQKPDERRRERASHPRCGYLEVFGTDDGLTSSDND